MNNAILDFFGFSHLPFSKILSPRQLFHSGGYKQAFAQLEYGIPAEDFMLLSGPVGCGKAVVVGAPDTLPGLQSLQPHLRTWKQPHGS